MSSKPIIQIQNIGKKYRIKESQVSTHRNFSEEIIKWMRKPWLLKEPEKEFWALRDLNLSIQAGESVGVIGPNGSGKSTLLKILARVIWPTTGRVELHGRISALLEVGTGFHLDLTGRENVYLSGAMLGMKRSEVTKHFDEIVAFSGVETFLDTPVKRYSSGMFLRLAFSVMAHLKSDILIIDEILAVGDSAFQEKCIQKMQSILAEGRTVMFVSHQMASIKLLCKRVLSISKGLLVQDGSVEEVLENYSVLNK
jgi:lipopolysaccharide transport system ATP-binding protein